jgi:mRNA interferase RelE/StbE
LYDISFTKRAIKDLRQMPVNYSKKILEKIKVLAQNPYLENNNVKRLKTSDEVFRLRIGDYRVLYEIANKKLLISVIKIQTRGNVYD